MRLLILAAVIYCTTAAYIPFNQDFDVQAPGTTFDLNKAQIIQDMSKYDLTSNNADVNIKVGIARTLEGNGKFAVDTSAMSKQLTNTALANKLRAYTNRQQQIDNGMAAVGSQKVKREAPAGPQFDFGDYQLVFFVNDITL